MRPEILFPLFADVTSLPGVGPRLAKLVERLAGPHVVDLCWHLPVNLIDRRYAPTVAEAREGQVATLTVTVDAHEKPPTKRSPYRVRCRDETGFITLVFFHARDDYLRRLLPEGQVRVVSGVVEDYQGGRQITHPDHVVPENEKHHVQIVEPVYPLTAGLSLKVMTRAVRGALAQAPDLPEWLDPAYQAQQGWPLWVDALRTAHSPEGLADIDPLSAARCRLAYDELLANQLALALVRLKVRRGKGRVLKSPGVLRNQLVAALPFALTGAQDNAIAEILADMAAGTRMLRLLQGDVGSGKTLVALMAMLTVVEEGAQAAFRDLEAPV